MSINTSLQNLLCEAVADDLNLGFIDVYTGSIPGPTDSPTGSLLFSISLQADAYGVPSGGSALANGVLSAIASGGGIAGYGQQRNAANTRWIYKEIGAVGSGAPIQMQNLNVTIGSVQTINLSTLTMPAT